MSTVRPLFLHYSSQAERPVIYSANHSPAKFWRVLLLFSLEYLKPCFRSSLPLALWDLFKYRLFLFHLLHLSQVLGDHFSHSLGTLGILQVLSVSCTRKGTCLFPIGASGLEDLSECVCWINKRWEYPGVSHSNLSLTCWWALVASSNLPLPLPQLTPTFHSIVQVSFGAHRPAAFDPLTILCLSREPPTRYSKKHHTFLSKKTAFSSLIKG